ncbi:Sensor protein QseC [Achromobacter deleyi]|uniref:histidine kinase n=1 Tax=Achromobacter deleyi TaxID=1353891 RepID=A0A6S6ZZ08_9BURK|nr:ATP-binding protein [Achromobacter deleyi]CAB3704345.1 Sensor protein QseC [Achromobacter deleyi]CAB3849375.1 Sensor protein QseC [Achromobacter deleyi]CAB3850802.1 Sensor protein QseC [Achromobacter deleyi]CAB3856446.1 Sensor protein QseC [Achromobacter deleyi]
MKTLRRRLTITLLLTLLLTWAAVFFCQQHAMNEARTGIRDQALMDSANQTILSLRRNLLAEMTDERFELPPSSLYRGDRSLVQIWSLQERRLVLRSPEAPAQPLNPGFEDGFSDGQGEGEGLRVYTLSDAFGQVQVQMARADSVLRAEAVAAFKRGLLIVSALFLLLAAAIWIVVRQAFARVDQAGEAIQQRAPFDLAPLPLDGLPGELHPYVQSINTLLLRLQAAMDHERRFLADAAHELRTPLAALSAQTELLLQGIAGTPAAEVGVKLRAVAQRTARLAEQLLDQARMDAVSEKGADLEAVALDQLVVLLVRDSESAASRKRQRIQLDVQACEVRGRMDSLGMLVRNLLDNALRYTPENGQIAVACGPAQDGGAWLRVADDGPGIAPRERVRVFDRFYRGVGAGAGDGGSGIGLSLVAQIAARHGATVAFAPGLNGRGVALVVTFPGDAAPANT